MRKFSIILFLTLLAGCATDTPEPTTSSHETAPVAEASAATPSPAKHTDGFVFVYNGQRVYMEEDMADVVERLGEPLGVHIAPTCAFEGGGNDSAYSYQGIEIYTYPKNGQDFVYMIIYRDDSFGTPEGIYIGSPLVEALASYGDGYVIEDEVIYRYTKGQTYLSFMVDGQGRIMVIEYGLII